MGKKKPLSIKQLHRSRAALQEDLVAECREGRAVDDRKQTLRKKIVEIDAEIKKKEFVTAKDPLECIRGNYYLEFMHVDCIFRVVQYTPISRTDEGYICDIHQLAGWCGFHTDLPRVTLTMDAAYKIAGKIPLTNDQCNEWADLIQEHMRLSDEAGFHRNKMLDRYKQLPQGDDK